MGKMISIEGYINQKFDPAGAPTPQTVRKWCAKGDVPARKIGGSWFIILENKIETTGNSLVDKVLAG